MSRGKKPEPLEEGIGLASRIALELLRQSSLALEQLEEPSAKELKEFAGMVKGLQDMLETEVDIRRKQAELELCRRKLTQEGGQDVIRVILGEAGEYAN